VGISRKDYANIELSEDEIAAKTWIFLDDNMIKWGIFDDDLYDKKKSEKMMKWCSSLQKETEEYFAKFYSSHNNEPTSARNSHHSRDSEYKARTI
jgi:hypothetical protein